MEIILVRYAEIGLKSRPVRKRFEAILRDNMLSSLAKQGVEALVSSDQGRFYLTTGDPVRAMTVVSRVFGVASLSLAVETSSDLHSLCSEAADYSVGRLKEGQSFAVRARREGAHTYTSVDLGREVGSAIFLKNEQLGPKVDLSTPDVEFFVEVREKRAFIFDHYVNGPGGLPLGSQGKVVARVDEEKDALAAWLMMKRGCRAMISSDGEVPLLEPYDPNLRVESASVEALVRRHDALGVVYGHQLNEFDRIKEVKATVPAFFPLVGMNDLEVAERLERIRV